MSGRYGEGMCSLPLQNIEHQFLGNRVRSPVAILTEVSERLISTDARITTDVRMHTEIISPLFRIILTTYKNTSAVVALF
jgi:hypothetical protein